MAEDSDSTKERGIIFFFLLPSFSLQYAVACETSIQAVMVCIYRLEWLSVSFFLIFFFLRC